ncbi:hypothetical protein [Streptomyces spiramenti]|uniref:Uncharacterized protein n=1 Tax=Streptomyces spiramenti TaxID=2720606 RepID=A0ABX1AML6_9ACTN|nr:hypothetical protein [Streptomyces spiramenti]NJP68347.1 hypothetical protein [Streptomyces spiramenti]
MSGPDVTFTPSNAKAEAGKDPWKRTNDFTTEIDPGEMLATSREFANAGGEAGYAGELAVSASEETADAAEIGGQKMHDIEAHVAETSNLLQGDGEALFGVAEKLGTVVELAEESIDLVEARIEQLDEDLPALSDEGQTEMDNFAAEILSEYLKTANDLPEGVELEKVPVIVRVSYGGEEYRSLNGAVPADLVDAVAEYWLERGATAVKNADTAIEEALDEYHASLTKISSDLGEYGYTGAGSPVSIFHTEQMAEYQAERLKIAIEEEDFDAIHDASRFIGDIANRLATTPGAELTAAERDFLHAFYDALSAEDLAALGNLEQSLNPYGATERDLRIAQGAIGDGILALANPEIGGLDVPSHLPQSIYDLVYGAEVGTEKPDGYESLVGYDPETGEFVVSGLSEYLGFSSLMEHSTLAPGHDFGVAMAESAIRVETQFNAMMANVEASGTYTGITVDTPDGYVTLDEDLEERFRSLHPGGSEVLEAVSRNVDASQTFLSTPEHLEKLMGLGWGERDAGAVSMLEVATDRNYEDPGRARVAAEIAQSVFTTIGSDPSTWRELVPKGTNINDAILGVAEQYIDVFAVSRGGGAESEIVVDPSTGLHGFLLGGGDGEGLDFLEFVGLMNEGATHEEFLEDPDAVRLRAAAEIYFLEQSNYVHDNQDWAGYRDLEQEVGQLFGNLARYDMVAAGNVAKDEVEAAALAYARQQVVKDAVFDLVVNHPIGRGISLGLSGGEGQGVVEKEVREAAQAAAKKLAGVGASNVQNSYSEWVDSIFEEKPDDAESANTLLAAMDEKYGSGRAEINYLIMGQMVGRGDESVGELFDEHFVHGERGDGERLKPLSEMSEAEIRRLGTAVEAVKIGGKEMKGEGVWQYEKEMFSDLKPEHLESRNEVDRHLVHEVRNSW